MLVFSNIRQIVSLAKVNFKQNNFVISLACILKTFRSWFNIYFNDVLITLDTWPNKISVFQVAIVLSKVRPSCNVQILYQHFLHV